MGLSDALVTFEDGEQPDAFLQRALQAAKDAGGSGRLRLEVGTAWQFSTGDTFASVSLWVERGRGRTESWQKVTPPILNDTFEVALGPFARALDEDRKNSPK